MDMGALRTLVRDLNFSVHGFAITVTRPLPDDGPIATSGIWVPSTDEAQPFGTDVRRREPRRILAIPRDTVMTQIPRGTIVLAPEQEGGVARTWRVDGYDRTEADHFRVLLVSASDLT